MRIPASLRVTVPVILLGFAATLSAANLLYHVPQAEHAEEEDGRKRLAQEMSRLQSTLEYLLLKGDVSAAQHEIAVLAHSHDVTLAALADDRGAVIAATRDRHLEMLIGKQTELETLAAGAGAPDAGPIEVDRGGLGLALVHARVVLDANGATTWSCNRSRQAIGVRLPLS